jgi:hypothetical protein
MSVLFQVLPNKQVSEIILLLHIARFRTATLLPSDFEEAMPGRLKGESARVQREMTVAACGTSSRAGIPAHHPTPVSKSRI